MINTPATDCNDDQVYLITNNLHGSLDHPQLVLASTANRGGQGINHLIFYKLLTYFTSVFVLAFLECKAIKNYQTLSIDGHIH